MTTQRPWRGALIGCGFFARNHLAAWRDMGEVELTAVCDIDREKARSAAEAFGAPRFYDDAKALFAAETLDFVDITTRMESHRPLAALAAAHGVAAIVQKPLAPDWAEAVALVATAREKRARLAVHENFRFQPPIRALKQKLDEGAIGAASWARIAFRTHFDVYANQPYFHHEKRLVLLDLGVHVLDVARFLLGEVARVSCETQRRNPANAGEDTATMLLRHESAAVSVVDCSYEARIHPDPFPDTLVAIEGERGALELGRGGDARLFRDGVAEKLEIASAPPAWAEPPWGIVQESVLRTQRAIVDAWRRGVDAETSGEDNLKTFALVEAAYLAAETGRATAPGPMRG